MSLWFWVLAACIASFAQKLVGYLVPAESLDSPRFAHVAGSVTVGLLAALVMTQTFASGSSLVLDARLGAVVVAAVALWLRAPFIVVVLLGAVTAAGLRALGLAA
ncbi:Branched-chain amino acid transport protein (AzlD) [Tessaracoccus bendigoensis DSM 12906]|uniref:Branched-chain amino acid transport protein (AzlD) n=1 Tax=Tessaracoccus bendigoensis DSM 12906 TaxID=1123357 RepID=A0A1M6P4C4_9ACTN|nr:AzlD domain-containing protein [Tessaracoccus bendigoensis]SHK02752.1 Branched-chain amino acid transport protein (AzlD) [Tessaracoccus bendigoensis DSM 12906]